MPLRLRTYVRCCDGGGKCKMRPVSRSSKTLGLTGGHSRILFEASRYGSTILFRIESKYY